jgi:hypothetical protein
MKIVELGRVALGWVAGLAVLGAVAASAAPTELATVTNSGSTNAIGFRLVVFNDGSADMGPYGGRAGAGGDHHYPAGSVDTQQLGQLLRAAGDLSRLKPQGHCFKSASFGTTTTISAGGKTSPDLTCCHTAQAKNLLRFVSDTYRKLTAGS